VFNPLANLNLLSEETIQVAKLPWITKLTSWEFGPQL